MYKTLIVLCALPAILVSCSDGAKKKKGHDDIFNDVRVDTASSEYSGRVLDLSGNENISNLLCQGWEMEDDVAALKGMDDNSKLVIAFRSFYLSPDHTFIKNPRNAMDHGKWEYDDNKKTITFHYAIDGGKDVYKIAALAPDELSVKNQGINTSTILKFISPARRLANNRDEPYHISNNYWRIRPSKKETILIFIFM